MDVVHAFAMTFQVLLGVSASVLDVYFKCFICLQTYVANVSSGLSRLGAAVGTHLP
jgi:hypothetical protein